VGTSERLACAVLALLATASSAGGQTTGFPGRNGKFVVDNRGIVVVNPDGSGLRRFSRSDDDSGPAWSPTGTEIAFSRDLGNGGEIIVTTSDGMGSRRLVRAPGDGLALSPTWSPDGTKIAFYQEADDEDLSGIFVIGTDGTGMRKLTKHGYTDTEPAWSPDGRWIAFAAVEQGSNKEIHVVRSDGTGRRKVADGARPAWSPDSHSLLYVAEQDRFYTYAVNADETGRRVISRAPSGDQDASAEWSPDGRSIAISRLVYERPGISSSGYRVYLVNADGRDFRRIPVNGFSVDWQRVTKAPPSFSDARTRAGRLDLARIVVLSSGRRLKLAVETWAPWRTGSLLNGHGLLTVFYDTDLDGRADVRQRLRPSALYRPSAKAVLVAHDFGQGTVRVRVTSLWRDRGRCRHGCWDRIPDQGWLTAREARR